MNKFKYMIFAMLLAATGASAKKPAYVPRVERSISLMSEPAGAQVYLDGRLICPSTPGVATISVPASDNKNTKNMLAAFEQAQRGIKLVFVKEGYVTGEVVLEPAISWQKRMLQLDWPGSAVFRFAKDPNSAYVKDPTIVDGEARTAVSRDASGQSALERTVIRWFFDSDPRGARIFWRVISSVPAEVKNTNETYLMTTPYEETRSFNILGLTYENSRDVVIEIKASKKGYEDQIKRFNVRQAIDQQEISGFFDLVKREE